MEEPTINETKFIFEYMDKRLEFSQPSIQAFDDDKPHITGKDIMYYYYTLTLFDKIEVVDDDYDKPSSFIWEEITHVNAYDVPAIRCLQNALKHILHFNVKEHGFNIKLGKEDDDECQEWKYAWNIDGWIFKEDEYIITKTKRRVWQLRRYNEPCWYDMYVGCGGYGKHNTVGVNLVMLGRKDLTRLKTVVDKFIKYSLDQYNQEKAACAKQNP